MAESHDVVLAIVDELAGLVQSIVFATDIVHDEKNTIDLEETREKLEACLLACLLTCSCHDSDHRIRIRLLKFREYSSGAYIYFFL